MYNKAIAAFATAVIGLLAQFGIELPESVATIINGLVPVVGAALVYLIPNKTG